MSIILPVYSFADIYGMFAGPGIALPFGMNTGSAEEGINWEQSEDSNKKTVGSGGDVMNTLILDDSGRCSIHVLKTSPLNAAFNAAFAYQKQSSLFWGKNVITMTNPVIGDQYTGSQVAFTRRPPNSFGKDPVPVVWEFDCGHIYAVLGA